MAITAHCGKNLSSFKSIRLIRLDQVSSFPLVMGNQTIGNLSITGSLPVSTREHSGSLNEEVRESPDGPLTDITATASIVRTNQDKEAKLQAYLNKRLVVLIQDNNGQAFFIGTPDEPARMSYNPVSEEGLAGLQGIRLTVNYKGNTPKIYYTGTIPA